MRKLSPLMRRAASGEEEPEADTWIDRELAECEFKDVRLFQRFRKLLGQVASAMGQTIPFVCQDWANTKAAYRFFPMSASTKKPFCLAIFKQRVIELQRSEGRFWFSTTRRNLPISEISRTWWELPAEFPRAKIEKRKYATI